MTPRELYMYAKENKIVDAEIRICDGMAISFYPQRKELVRGRYECIIDLSTSEPVEFDDLPISAYAQLYDTK